MAESTWSGVVIGLASSWSVRCSSPSEHCSSPSAHCSSYCSSSASFACGIYTARPRPAPWRQTRLVKVLVMRKSSHHGDLLKTPAAMPIASPRLILPWERAPTAFCGSALGVGISPFSRDAVGVVGRATNSRFAVGAGEEDVGAGEENVGAGEEDDDAIAGGTVEGGFACPAVGVGVRFGKNVVNSFTMPCFRVRMDRGMSSWLTPDCRTWRASPTSRACFDCSTLDGCGLC